MQRLFLLPALLVLSAAIMLLAPACPAMAQKLVPTSQIDSSLPMLPYMEWLLDPTGDLTVEDVAAKNSGFMSMEKDFPLKAAGACWLRFTLAPRLAESRPVSLLLDMGDGHAARMTLYAPRRNAISDMPEWQSMAPSQRAVFLAPDAQGTPLTVYIRMENLPDLWFYPMLRTPQNAATAIERMAYPAALVALAVVMLLCLLRGFTENGQWRVWTGLYAASALFYAVWGAPGTPQGRVTLHDLAAVLGPGISLMLLPHVARHLMDTRRRSKALDAQYLLLSLPGAALAILPVIPGYAWVCRYLDLWPLGAAVLLPTTLGAWVVGMPGAARFLLGCIVTSGGAAFSLLDLESALKSGIPTLSVSLAGVDLIPAFVQANAPLWGLALGALIITGMAAPKEYSEESNAKKAKNAAKDAPKAVNALEIAIGDMEELAPVADSVAAAPASEAAPAMNQSAEGAEFFDLQLVMREAHDAVAEEAENKGVAVSWFMPPHLANMYEGNGASLGEVMRLLMESAMRATTRGAVQMSVRRVPESTDPGLLLFSVTDTGEGMPPDGRNAAALAKTWELAGAHRGFLAMECGPQGTSISFTLRLGLHVEPIVADALGALEAEHRDPDDSGQDPLSIIVADENAVNRQLLVFYLEGLPHRVREARSCLEAVDLYAAHPAGLIIFNDQMPIDMLQKAIEEIRVIEKREALPPAATLAVTNDRSQWDILGDIGFTHGLPNPVTRTGLRRTVLDLLPTFPENDRPAWKDDLGNDGHGFDADAPLAEHEVAAMREPEEAFLSLDIPGAKSAAHSEPEVSNAASAVPAPEASVAQAGTELEMPDRDELRAAFAGSTRAERKAAAPKGEPGELTMEPKLDLLTPEAPYKKDMLPVTAEAPAAVVENVDAPLPGLKLQESEPKQEAPEMLTLDSEAPSKGPSVPGVEKAAEAGIALPDMPGEPPRPKAVGRLDLGLKRVFSRGKSSATSTSMPEINLEWGDKAQGDSGGGAADEWVGEPQPIVKTAKASPEASEPVRQLGSPGKVDPSAGKDEWVGEPQPIVKERTTANFADAPAKDVRPVAADPLTDKNDLVGKAQPLAVDPSAGKDEWVGEPRPIVKKPEDEGSIAQSLSGRRTEREKKKGRARPSLIPTPTMLDFGMGVGGEQQEPGQGDSAFGFEPTPQEPERIAETKPVIPARTAVADTGADEAHLLAAPEATKRDSGHSSAARAEKFEMSEFLSGLDAAMTAAKIAKGAAEYQDVAQAAFEIAERSESRGLKVLARIARYVERAARAEDGEALGDLLPELETAVERNRIVISKGL